MECTVGDVLSQTTLKKSEEAVWYEFKELLPFTLESIPGKIEIAVKDKDMVNDKLMGKIVLNPQKELLFEASASKKEQRLEVQTETSKIVLYLETSFKLKEAV